MPDQNFENLRLAIKRQRRALSRFQQSYTENAILKQLMNLPEFRYKKNIGLYLHAFGEVQTQKIIQQCFIQQKNVYLPMIVKTKQKLAWIKITRQRYQKKQFSRHRLKMLEPKASRGLKTSSLDFLIMPLVACDPKGTRIGMGGGFYDQALANAPQMPFRLGLAHSFQYFETDFDVNPWDQSLDALLTPKQLHRFKHNRS